MKYRLGLRHTPQYKQRALLVQTRIYQLRLSAASYTIAHHSTCISGQLPKVIQPELFIMFSYRGLRIVLAFVILLLLLTQVTAHLELTLDELAKYSLNLKRDSEAWGDCMKSLEMREHNVRMLGQRDQTLNDLRKARAVDPDRGKNCSVYSYPMLNFHRKAQPRRCYEVRPRQS
jgi:hypothetical protein